MSSISSSLYTVPSCDFSESFCCLSNSVDITEGSWHFTDSEVSVESEGPKAQKRKASTDIEPRGKRRRSGDDDPDLSLNSGDPSSSNEENWSTLLIGRTSRADFKAKYQQLGKLGQGGFGSVYAGIRESDKLPVAIKYIPKSHVKAVTLVSNEGKFMIPLEVLVMVRVAGAPGSRVKSAAVSFIEWYNLDKGIIIIMERPVPAVDLSTYVQCRGGQLDEGEAKIIIKQLVEAAIEMHSKGVFHRDIKLNNVLIQNTSDGPRVRIIDFGCSCFANRPCSSFSGTFAFAPPEYFIHQMYEAGPSTVWQLGALLFNMVDGGTSFTTSDFTHRNIRISSELSHECRLLLNMCLAISPKNRATLQKLQRHPWSSRWMSQDAASLGRPGRWAPPHGHLGPWSSSAPPSGGTTRRSRGGRRRPQCIICNIQIYMNYL
ncbi:serine/threonine-protein kinase pim-2-like isoform X1 [Paralichthys olivaceus]|uniref:serine/threonine-protein kinase pim-2-like isoform X1 n=1 Tax=Paralichthys olivaceus TaxID=8255 RepID=UPI0037517DAA